MTDITVIPEYALTRLQREEIVGLRAAAFPEYGADRTYFKQLPHHRVLAYQSGQLIGQVGIDYRVISVGGKPMPVFGLIDLCVAQSARSQGVGTAILLAVERLGRENGVPFVLLSTDAHRFYARLGYVQIDAECTWLRIDEHASLGQTTERLDGELMVYAIQDDVWPTGPLDFLGYHF